MNDKDETATPKPARRRTRKPASTPARAYGRSLSDFEPLKPAEKILLDATARGEVAHIGDERPEEATEENSVRAGFLRFLLLGGDERAAVHERGARLKGAYIGGELNLESCRTVSAVDCAACTFDDSLIFRRSTLSGGIFLEESCAPLFDGDSATIRGNVFLGNFKVVDSVWLLNTQIDGNLDCSNAQIGSKGSYALIADRCMVKGTIFLRGFKSIGSVRFPGAHIGSNLECEDAKFDGKGNDALIADNAVIQGNVFLRGSLKAVGTTRLTSAQIGGDLDCSNAQFDGQKHDAINAQRLHVTGGFIFRDLADSTSKIDLTAASVGVLVDDANAWGNDLVLDGFNYHSITGRSPPNAVERLAWLDKQYSAMSGLSGTGVDFRPQPWKQLQKVLRDLGHTEDARQVAIALEHRMRKVGFIGQSPETLRYWPRWTNRPRRWLYRQIANAVHWCFWALTGYGYRPMRLMVWMLAMWLGCALFYWWAALPPQNVFAPSNPLVFQHVDYRVCIPGSPEARAVLAKPPERRSVAGAGNWYLCQTLREEYTGFSPLAYSLDVILPLVDLQQQKDWGPMIPTPRPSIAGEYVHWSLKHVARFVLWFETLFGWVASLLLVAIVSGLTKRRED